MKAIKESKDSKDRKDSKDSKDRIHTMKPKSEKSIELYNIMLKKGYPEPFCDEVTRNLNTDFTAKRMIGYLSHYQKLSMEDVADEVLAILSDRNRIMQQHEMIRTNMAYNEYLNRRLTENEDDENM